MAHLLLATRKSCKRLFEPTRPDWLPVSASTAKLGPTVRSCYVMLKVAINRGADFD